MHQALDGMAADSRMGVASAAQPIAIVVRWLLPR